MNWDYPELYYRVYPKVIQSVNKHVGDIDSYENIPKSKIDTMVDEVYYDLAREYPEIDSDPLDRRVRGRARAAQGVFFGRRRIIRDLITIFIISELLRRRRIDDYSRPYNPYFYPL